MFSLSSLELQANTKKFSRKTKKFIRVSVKNSMSSSKQSSIYVNDATLKWSQSLTIPEVYDQDIDFEIYDKHEFGYNPQQLQTVLYGTIKISPEQKMGKWSVFSTAEDHKKIGALVIDVRRQTKPAQPPTRTLTSLLVRKLKEEVPKGYFVIKNNQKVIRTNQTISISKQLLFTQTHELGRPKDEDNLIFELYSSKDKSLARGMIKYEDCRSSNKIDLYSNEDNENFGELYFQLSEHMNNNNNFKASRVDNKSYSSLNKHRVMSESHLTKNNYSTMFRGGQSRKKKVSALHNNNDVVFPKQERFQTYQDRQTNIISYSKLSTFQFTDKNSNKSYKGASFGIGQKSDFTLPYKGNPGVGNYKLPSIFDRY